jgi:hypothetical protein
VAGNKCSRLSATSSSRSSSDSSLKLPSMLLLMFELAVVGLFPLSSWWSTGQNIDRECQASLGGRCDTEVVGYLQRPWYISIGRKQDRSRRSKETDRCPLTLPIYYFS